MNARPRPPQTLPPGWTRAFAFTLATALAWAGHDCRGGCPARVSQLRATVWFVGDPPRTGTAGRRPTLVVVDFGDHPGSPASTRALLRQVNRCTHDDLIRVRVRTFYDQAKRRGREGGW